MQPAPNRGELWWVDLDPVVGTELGRKVRPAVVISDDGLNHSRLDKVVVVPSTTQAHDVAWRVEWAVRTPRGTRLSFFCCDDVRSVSIERLQGRIGTGRLPPAIVEQIEHVLRMLLSLD
jgi:mRNA interferase MazF